MQLKILIGAAAIFALFQVVMAVACRKLHGRLPKVLWMILALQYIVPSLAIVARKMSPMVPSEFGYYHDLEFLPVVTAVVWIPLCMIISVVPIVLMLRECLRLEQERTNKPFHGR